MKQIDPEIISKLTKILRLAGDKAAHPGEVENAMAKARAIAVQHNIELSSIDLTDDTKVADAMQVSKDSTLRTSTNFERRQHPWIYRVVREVFGVHIILNYRQRGSRRIVNCIHLIGDPVDVAIAKEIFPFLEKSFVGIFNRAVREGTLVRCAADMNGCYRGVYRGILETNRREEAKTVQTSSSYVGPAKYALVLRKKEELIEAAEKKFFPDAEPIKQRQKQVNHFAEAYGTLEGRKINLRQIEQSAKLKLR